MGVVMELLGSGRFLFSKSREELPSPSMLGWVGRLGGWLAGKRSSEGSTESDMADLQDRHPIRTYGQPPSVVASAPPN